MIASSVRLPFAFCVASEVREGEEVRRGKCSSGAGSKIRN